jgi:hypothetical protein
VAMFFFQKRLNGYPLTGIAKDGFVSKVTIRKRKKRTFRKTAPIAFS